MVLEQAGARICHPSSRVSSFTPASRVSMRGANREMRNKVKRYFRVFAALAALVLTTSAAHAADRDLFVMDARVAGILNAQGGDNDVVDLVDDFISARSGSPFAPLIGILGYQGSLDYLGIPDAIQFDVQKQLGGQAEVRLRIPITGTDETFSAATVDAVTDEIEDWLEGNGISEWADFLRASNALSPLALLSGNPRSSVALMGDSAYRKFGFDDSHSRMGFGESKQRFGGFVLRVDAGISSVNTAQFSDDLWAIDPSITLAGEFGRYVGLSFSIVGQYRDYNGAKMADLGLELAVPITLKRPDRGPTFWQITPFLQAAAGASKATVAGGLFMGGGLVNALGYNRGRFEILMANEMAYYGGIPIDNIGGYDFETDLSQLYFKNGLEGTWWMGAGFYADAGVHFTNFVVDAAAVSWFVTPTVGLGWELGRWMDLRLAYEADLDNKDYKAHNLQVKLDFLF